MLLLNACGNAPQISSEEAAAFHDAPPEIKQTWERALAAGKASDYGTAASAFFRLMREHLTPEQGRAVRSAIIALNHRMYAAAEKGDPAALKALEDTKVASQRR